MTNERLLAVGEHECVTCERCAFTFAAVHPACARCHYMEQLREARQAWKRMQEASPRTMEWHDAADDLDAALREGADTDSGNVVPLRDPVSELRDAARAYLLDASFGNAARLEDALVACREGADTDADG